jgi:hypothetical protein
LKTGSSKHPATGIENRRQILADVAQVDRLAGQGLEGRALRSEQIERRSVYGFSLTGYVRRPAVRLKEGRELVRLGSGEPAQNGRAVVRLDLVVGRAKMHEKPVVTERTRRDLLVNYR